VPAEHEPRVRRDDRERRARHGDPRARPHQVGAEERDRDDQRDEQGGEDRDRSDDPVADQRAARDRKRSDDQEQP
jgi:hypothetical protein